MNRPKVMLSFRFRTVVACAFALMMWAMSGCSGFFTQTATGECAEFFHDTAQCTTSSTASTNYAFVANQGSNTVTGFGISTAGALTALSGGTITFSAAPTALAVSKDNKFLWVASNSQIYGFSISSTGTIAQLNGGAGLVNSLAVDMQVSPDGKWLMTLEGTGVSIGLFAINSDGTLTTALGGSFQPAQVPTPAALRINPAGTIVAAALGAAGEVLYSFNTATGTFTQISQTPSPNTSTNDTSITWDSTGQYLYVTRTGANAGLVINQVSSTGILTPTTSTVYSTGSNPRSVVIDNSGKYVYVANSGDGTISGWSIGSGAALTALTGSPFTSGGGVSRLGADSTGKWLLATAQNGSPDLSLYGFDATTGGKLNSIATTATGTTALSLALSH